MGVPSQTPGLIATKAVAPIDNSDTKDSLAAMLALGIRVFSMNYSAGCSTDLMKLFKELMAAKKESGASVLCSLLNVNGPFDDEAQQFAFSHGVGYIAVPVSSPAELESAKTANPRLRTARFLAKLTNEIDEIDALKIVEASDGLLFESAIDVTSSIAEACVAAGKPCVCTGTEGNIVSTGRALFLEKQDSPEVTAAAARQALSNVSQLDAKNVGPAPAENAEGKIAEALALAESAKLIVVLTETGDTVRQIARACPKKTILAVSASTAVCGHLQLVRGVVPLQTGSMQSPSIAIESACKNAVDIGLASVGDSVVSVTVLKEGCASAQVDVASRQI